MGAIAGFRFYTGKGDAVASALGAWRRLAPGLAVALALACSGCAGFVPPRAETPERTDIGDVPTGSIRVPTTPVTSQPLPPLALAQTTPAAEPPTQAGLPPSLASAFSENDRETVHAALKTALLDQERAATVPWLNDISGHGGLISPVGPIVMQGDRVCRAVLVSIQRNSEAQWLQGMACRQPGGDWALGDMKPWNNPA